MLKREKIKKKKLLRYQEVGEQIEDAKENFRIKCFLKILSNAIISVKRTFETSETQDEMFVLV